MLWLQIDKTSSIPMIRQIYAAVRQRILQSSLLPGTRLPSSRDLASQLKISRNVVLEAYDLLYAEGFLETRRGAGTFVAEGAAFEKPAPAKAPTVGEVTMGYDCPAGIINFRAGTPDLRLFPHNTWLRLYRDLFSAASEEILAYGHPEGREELRQAICHYVVGQREVSCHPDQIVVTAGTTQAIGIVCHLLAKNNAVAVIEDPITNDIQAITGNCGYSLARVPVDGNGLQTERLPKNIKPAFVYVTPSHQFPIGGTLPIQRRIELLNYAEEKDCYIIEDDYDSEFRFDGPPLSSLHGLNPERVIYIGTFSKTLCPAIRVGYLILPPELINLGRRRKWHSDLHNEITSQLVLAKFIADGSYLKHVSKMRKRYRRRREALVKALHHYFGANIDILGSATGLHLSARFHTRNFTPEILRQIEEHGARFYSVSTHSANPWQYTDTLLIGYGNLDTAAIVHGIDILHRCLTTSQGILSPPQ